jgi:hypothetical protein
MSRLVTLTRFVQSVGRWLAAASLLWLLVAVLAAALFAAFWPAPSEQNVRVAGWVLELCGLFTVAWGLRETRRHFERPSLSSIALEWWNRRPRIRSKVVTATAAISLGAAMTSGRGYGWHGTSANATVEDRVLALEANVKDINERVNTALRELDQEVRVRSEDIKIERSKRETAIAEVHRKLETAETGGLHISAVGVVWLAVGLTMSTIPVELIALLK